MKYSEALDYLYSFIDPARLPGGGPGDANRNLPRARALLAAAGNPQQALQTVVVAGTKGKGSTCAMLEHIVRAAGYRTGLWTSPHLNSFRERIRLDFTPIAPVALAQEVAQLKPIIEAFDNTAHGPPTFFEMGFVLALRYFAAQQVDLAIIEVGLGGRYDCSNVLTPLVSAISSISYDHMHILGDTLSEIAGNKADIAKAGVPLVTVPQAAEAAAVIAATAARENSLLYLAAADGLQRHADPGDQRAYPVPPEPARLRGSFQRENARLALGIAMLLNDQGIILPVTAIADGLANAHWPGRIELVAEQPAIVLDGAHNGDSAQKLATALREQFDYRRLHLILATLRDKDIAAISAALAPIADTVLLTSLPHYRSQADLDLLEAAARPHLRGELLRASDMAAALAEARRRAAPEDLICVSGALAAVGAARSALGLAEDE
jgi:dihydrofolate synthase/folylpolyglutamate synthase